MVGRKGGCPTAVANRLSSVPTCDTGSSGSSDLISSRTAVMRLMGSAASVLTERNASQVCAWVRSEEHTSELQSRLHLVCRLLLEKKKKQPLFVTESTHTTTSTPASPHS